MNTNCLHRWAARLRGLRRPSAPHQQHELACRRIILDRLQPGGRGLATSLHGSISMCRASLLPHCFAGRLPHGHRNVQVHAAALCAGDGSCSALIRGLGDRAAGCRGLARLKASRGEPWKRLWSFCASLARCSDQSRADCRFVGSADGHDSGIIDAWL